MYSKKRGMGSVPFCPRCRLPVDDTVSEILTALDLWRAKQGLPAVQQALPAAAGDDVAAIVA